MHIRCKLEKDGKPCDWEKDVHLYEVQDEMDKHKRECHKPTDQVVKTLHPKKEVRDYYE